MKQGMMRAVVAVVGVCVAGCATQKGATRTTTTARSDGSIVTTVTDAVNAVMERDIAYYNQPNTAEMISAEGTNVTWTISGATRLVFSTPVPAKQLMPRDQAWYGGLFDTLKTVAPWLMMGWMIHDSGGMGSRSGATTTTTNNNY